ncbi:hypothetical protein ACWD4P_38180, partial [Kitasatospora sp. NPDC002543]
ARLGARFAARGRGLGPAMVGWQLARRPGRATGPVLLLVMAVATGVLALGQHATWTASQRDQAAFDTAGGLRISASHSALMGQGGRYGSLSGGDRLVPVDREEELLPNGRREVLAVDSAALAARVPVRDDLLDGADRAKLFGGLAQPAPTGAAAGVPLPGRPLRIDADLLVRDLAVRPVPPQLALLLQDRFGYVHKVPFTGLRADGEQRASASLSALVDAPAGSVAAPLTLVGATTSFGGGAESEVTVRRLAVSDSADGPATEVPVPAGLTWTAGTAEGPQLATGTPPPITVGREPADAGRLFTVRFAPKPGLAGPVPAVVRTAGTDAPSVLSGVATPGYLKLAGARTGDVVQVPFAGTIVQVRITGTVRAVPTAGPEALVVDLATTARMLAAHGRALGGHAEWWLPATGPGDRAPAEAAAALRAGPGSQDIRLYDEASEGRLGDPVGAAPQNALLAVAFVTAVLAAIGFGAAVAGSAHERSRDSALLLAL